MMRSTVIVCALVASVAAWAAPSSEQAVMWLEGEDRAQWGPAVEALLTEPDSRLPRDAVSSVFKRLDVLEPPHRARVAGGLRGRLDEPRVRDVLMRLLADPDEQVRNAALATLTEKHRIPVDSAEEAARIGAYLAGLLTPESVAAKDSLPVIADLYVQEHAAALGVPADDPAAFRREAARRSLPGVHAEPYFAALTSLIEAADWQTRRPAFAAFSLLIDGRVHEKLLSLTQSRNEYVVGNALEVLIGRGALDLVCAPLLEWALSPARARAGSLRYQRLNYAGGQCADRQLPQWLARYRQADGAGEQADYRRLIEHAPYELPQQRALLEALESDTDPFLREFARVRLEAKPVAAESGTVQVLSAAERAAAVAVMSAALLLGVATFLWGFRILQVRRLLRHLSLSQARSVGVGLVAMEGEVQPAQDGVLVHPGTEEACVYYTGADRAAPGHRFWLVDDSGRVLVEPRGAVLLSEDGVLLPGERVRLIATAQRLSRAGDDGKAPTVLRAGRTRTSAFARIGRALLESVMDRPTTRLLFSDPRRMLLIWDDAHGAPFASPRETALVFLSFALAATWMLAFLAAVLVLADDRFSATVRTLIG